MKGLRSTDALHSHQMMFLGIKDQSVSITSALTLKSNQSSLCGRSRLGGLQQHRGMGFQVNYY